MNNSVIIIGAGKVGTFLCHALSRAGYSISQIYSRTHEKAVKLASVFGAEAVDDIGALRKETGLVIVAVPDDEIKRIAGMVKDFQGIVVHTSGSVSIDVFKGKAKKSGVFYPLQTFGEIPPARADQIPVCIEASSGEVLDFLKEAAGKISSKVFQLDSEQRKVAHLAAVFASNFTNQLYRFSEEILRDSGLPFDLVRPLIEQTALKVMSMSPEDVQTGPASRGDIDTLKTHVELLRERPELIEIYIKFSKLLAKKHTGKDVEL